jgi:hypothetical protein
VKPGGECVEEEFQRLLQGRAADEMEVVQDEHQRALGLGQVVEQGG